ncbi:ComE operon protein 2 [Fictibacillus macauensis ZFHKF-1]|uniref:ComE operon protein 2 n=1 Tax=Fictibacillus macauensis ZFHKF-1 TaxID=1196324 RepID=I8AID7_9BACL|nr:ComE operon protein 2 [Fictibacillus macauensis]EIT85239.1 ComE operon protein 2 [Fictibacillus macauensis ZFHKF-1]
MERISWDHYFMAQSHLLAMRSTCTRLEVGATIVRDKRIIAGGYNGSISGGVHCIDEGCYVIDGHCVRTIHAEMNAILQCAKFGVPVEGAEMYVTHFPCLHCCRTIIQSGIKTLYYANDYKNHPYAIEQFREAGLTVKHVPFHNQHLNPLHEEQKELMHQLLHAAEVGADSATIASLQDKIEQLYPSNAYQR